MRKVLGGVLGLIALLCLGLAYSRLAVAEQAVTKTTDPAKEARDECADELAKKIASLYHSDKRQMLALQYNISVLKLASVTVKSKSKTVEGYLSKEEAKLAEILKNKDAQKLDDELKGLYSKYGKKEDDAVLVTRVNETYSVLSQGNYAKAKTRFRNVDLSAYINAHRLIYKDASPFKMEDAAILWLRAQISEGVEASTKRGSLEANLQEASSDVARLTGYIDPAKGNDEAQISEKIKTAEEDLRKEFIKLAETFIDERTKACATLATCATCGGADELRQSAMLKSIQKIGQDLQSDEKFRQKQIAEAIGVIKEKGMTLEVETVTVAPVTVTNDTIPVELKNDSIVPQVMVSDTVKSDSVNKEPTPKINIDINSNATYSAPTSESKIGIFTPLPITELLPPTLSPETLAAIQGLKEKAFLSLGTFNVGTCAATVQVERLNGVLINHITLKNTKTKVVAKVDSLPVSDPALEDLKGIAEAMVNDDKKTKVVDKTCSTLFLGTAF